MNIKNFKFTKRYTIFDKESKDHIIYRFKILESLGSGSFSNVYKTYDYKNKSYNAIKIINNLKSTNNPPNEVKILSRLKQKKKILFQNFLNILFLEEKTHIVFKLYNISLHKMIYNDSFKNELKLFRKKYCIQLFSALNYLNKNNIIHCDLKPNNIVLKDFH